LPPAQLEIFPQDSVQKDQQMNKWTKRAILRNQLLRHHTIKQLEQFYNQMMSISSKRRKTIYDTQTSALEAAYQMFVKPQS
jgi:hypothetical protein